MNVLRPFTREFWIDDHDVRRELKRVPPPGPKAVQQARLSAIALEGDRDQLRADLMRRLRENREEADGIHAMLDELDALRILDRVS